MYGYSVLCKCMYFSAFSGHGRSCSGYKHKASRILWKQVEPKVIQTSHRVGLGCASGVSGVGLGCVSGVSVVDLR